MRCPVLTCCPQGCKATICMPVNTPDIKVNNVRRLGGLVELVGESYQEAQTYAQVGGGGAGAGIAVGWYGWQWLDTTPCFSFQRE